MKSNNKAAYKKNKIKERLPQIEEMCRDGATTEDLGLALGVHRTTIDRWKKDYPEFAEATRVGEQLRNRELVLSAIKQAVGYSVKVTDSKVLKKKRWDENAKKLVTEEVLETVTYEKYFKPDARMTIFMLKNRMPKHYTDKQKIDPDDNKVQVIFKGMTDEEVQKILV